MSIQHRLADGPDAVRGAIPALHSGQALFRQAQAGCRDSLNELMGRHDGLVHAVVRRQVLGDLPYAEAVQAGRIGLWRAILGYDPGRGWAFSTYAWPSISRHVWRAVKETGGGCQPSVTVRAGPSVWASDPALIWQAGAIHRALYDLVSRLPRRLRTIVAARYGLAGCRVALYREIGLRLHLSRERVRQLHTEALVWLRHPAHSQQLRSLLGRHTLADYEYAEVEAQRWLRQRGGRHGRR